MCKKISEITLIISFDLSGKQQTTEIKPLEIARL